MDLSPPLPADKKAIITTTMNSSQALAAGTCTADVKFGAKFHLQHTYPWMSASDRNIIVEKMSAVLREGLTEQAPKLAAMQKRLNIFTLSPELRNKIYERALEDHSNYGVGGEVCIQGYHASEFDKGFAYRADASNVPALLQTSRQVRNETQELFFARTTFVAQILYDRVGIMKKWLLRLELPRRAQLTTLVLEMSNDDLSSIHSIAASQVPCVPRGLADAEASRWWDEEDAKPRKTWNVKETVVKYLGLDVKGVKMSAFVVKCLQAGSKEGEIGVLSRMSETLLYCPSCGHMDEADTDLFDGLVCIDCAVGW